MTDTYYPDDQALYRNIHIQAECLLHGLMQASWGIGLHMSTNKLESISFKQEVAISTSCGKPLKLLDQFIYLSSHISSTESDITIRIAKRSYRNLISDEIKRDFFQVVGVLVLLYNCIPAVMLQNVLILSIFLTICFYQLYLYVYIHIRIIFGQIYFTHEWELTQHHSKNRKSLVISCLFVTFTTARLMLKVTRSLHLNPWVDLIVSRWVY